MRLRPNTTTNPIKVNWPRNVSQHLAQFFSSLESCSLENNLCVSNSSLCSVSSVEKRSPHKAGHRGKDNQAIFIAAQYESLQKQAKLIADQQNNIKNQAINLLQHQRNSLNQQSKEKLSKIGKKSKAKKGGKAKSTRAKAIKKLKAKKGGRAKSAKAKAAKKSKAKKGEKAKSSKAKNQKATKKSPPAKPDPKTTKAPAKPDQKPKVDDKSKASNKAPTQVELAAKPLAQDNNASTIKDYHDNQVQS